VGKSGNSFDRLAVVIAIPRSVPAFDIAECDGHRKEHHRDMSAEQIAHGRTIPL
jgi:hypothetical protein